MIEISQTIIISAACLRLFQFRNLWSLLVFNVLYFCFIKMFRSLVRRLFSLNLFTFVFRGHLNPDSRCGIFLLCWRPFGGLEFFSALWSVCFLFDIFLESPFLFSNASPLAHIRGWFGNSKHFYSALLCKWSPETSQGCAIYGSWFMYRTIDIVRIYSEGGKLNADFHILNNWKVWILV